MPSTRGRRCGPPPPTPLRAGRPGAARLPRQGRRAPRLSPPHRHRAWRQPIVAQIRRPAMPDVAPIGADTLVIDMVRRFASERLAPGAAAREKAGAIEPEIVGELGELGVFGATTPAKWDGSEIDPV